MGKGEASNGRKNFRGGAPRWCAKSRVCRVKRAKNAHQEHSEGVVLLLDDILTDTLEGIAATLGRAGRGVRLVIALYPWQLRRRLPGWVKLDRCTVPAQRYERLGPQQPSGTAVFMQPAGHDVGVVAVAQRNPGDGGAALFERNIGFGVIQVTLRTKSLVSYFD